MENFHKFLMIFVIDKVVIYLLFHLPADPYLIFESFVFIISFFDVRTHNFSEQFPLHFVGIKSIITHPFTNS